MDKNIHDIDNIFHKAYQQFEDEPSESVWEKLNAQLDKEDAGKYKKRFIGWKRAAILLLFLLSGIVLYESQSILKKNGAEGFNAKNKIVKSDSSFYNHKNTPETLLINTYTKPGYPKQNRVINNHVETDSQYFKVSGLTKSAIINIRKDRNNKAPKLISLSARLQIDDYNGHLESQIKKQRELKSLIITGEKNRPFLSNIADLDLKYGYPFSKKNIDKMHVIDSAVKTAIVKAETEDSSIKSLAAIPAQPAVSINPSAANNNKKTSKLFKPYWTLSGYCSLDKSEFNLNNDLSGNIGGSQNEKEQINNREKHALSFSTGLMANRQFTKHFGFKTGILYSNTSISIDPQEIYATRESDGTIGYMYITSSGYGFVKPKFGLAPALGDSLQSSNAQQNLESFGIPLQILYRIDKRKFSFMPSAGISLNFITKATVQTQVKDAFNSEAIMINGLNGMKKIYLGFIADINFQYNYNTRLAFNLLPTLRYAVTSITQGNVVKTYPYSIGISAGITYKFLK
ncbi:MAG: outer membrane beta-barrel protein [Bacteroidota bacterium]|nr:outer membrane beta-barrel protein [Bacteroidota bacterium]